MDIKIDFTNYEYNSVPKDQKVFTAEQVGLELDFSGSTIMNIARMIGIEPGKVFSKKREISAFSYLDYLQIKDYLKSTKKGAKHFTEKTKKTIEELRLEHPLVKDERCFELNFWPDIVPECFRETDAWEV